VSPRALLAAHGRNAAIHRKPSGQLSRQNPGAAGCGPTAAMESLNRIGPGFLSASLRDDRPAKPGSHSFPTTHKISGLQPPISAAHPCAAETAASIHGPYRCINSSAVSNSGRPITPE